eukprot:9488820-Pyramimonas_sp.AAC.1
MVITCRRSDEAILSQLGPHCAIWEAILKHLWRSRHQRACARDGPQVRRSLSTPGSGVSGVACSQPRQGARCAGS